MIVRPFRTSEPFCFASAPAASSERAVRSLSNSGSLCCVTKALARATLNSADSSVFTRRHAGRATATTIATTIQRIGRRLTSIRPQSPLDSLPRPLATLCTGIRSRLTPHHHLACAHRNAKGNAVADPQTASDGWGSMAIASVGVAAAFAELTRGLTSCSYQEDPGSTR